MIPNCVIMRRVCVSSIIMLLFSLQISIMICPKILPEDITSGEVSSFLHALSSTTADNALATSGCERFRFWTSVISVILFALKNPAMSLVDQIRMPPDESAYTLWNTTIGDALSAVPQADMVALK